VRVPRGRGPVRRRDADQDRDPASPGPRPAWPAIAAVGVLVLVAHVAALAAYVVDDAFISMRYARNIASGWGPVFVPGDRVEGFSNPLFTYLLALLHPLASGEDAFPLLARAIGVVSAAACVVLLARAPLRGGAPANALAVAVMALSTSAALWSVAGLETMLYALLILAGVVVTLSRPRGFAAQAGAGALLAAIALSRPEGLIPAAALWLARLADRETRRDVGGHVTIALVALAPCAAYLAFRHAYYGEWLPNTYFAKHVPVARASGPGARYVGRFVLERWLLLAPIALAIGGRARRGRAASLALGVLAAYLPCVVLVGGDWMDQARFIAPVVPLLAIVIAEGALMVPELPGLRAARVPVRAVTVAGVVLYLVAVESALTLGERQRFWVNAEPYYATVGRLVAVVADPHWTIAAQDIGAIGWYGRIRVIDLLGLADRDIARGRTWADRVLAEEVPQIVLLHHDERPGAEPRWRRPRILDFDRVWVLPRASVPVPASLRVRADVADSVDARLARLSDRDRRALAALDRFLLVRQPDGLARTDGEIRSIPRH
jgi:arabinofuranosyltransferase